MFRRLHIGLMRSLHTSLNTSQWGCKLSTSMSSSTHFFQDFLYLAMNIAPATSTFLQVDTQPSMLLRSRCPNHLNLPRLITSATLWTHRKLYKSTLCFLCFSDTPHIHLIIIRSVLSRLSVMCRPLQTLEICFLHRPGFSPISCQYTLDTSLVYLSLRAVWCTLSCQDMR